jgi:hypothetical protein
MDATLSVADALTLLHEQSTQTHHSGPTTRHLLANVSAHDLAKPGGTGHQALETVLSLNRPLPVDVVAAMHLGMTMAAMVAIYVGMGLHDGANHQAGQ